MTPTNANTAIPLLEIISGWPIDFFFGKWICSFLVNLLLSFLNARKMCTIRKRMSVLNGILKQIISLQILVVHVVMLRTYSRTKIGIGFWRTFSPRSLLSSVMFPEVTSIIPANIASKTLINFRNKTKYSWSIGGILFQWNSIRYLIIPTSNIVKWSIQPHAILTNSGIRLTL